MNDTSAVNGYNPHLLETWGANVDIQYILQAYTLTYITSYQNKKAGIGVTQNSHSELQHRQYQ